MYLDVTKMSTVHDLDVVRSLPAYHAFTGCDSVSFFAGKGKLNGFKLLKQSKEHQTTFQMLGNNWDVDDNLYLRLEGFTCKLYGYN